MEFAHQHLPGTLRRYKGEPPHFQIKLALRYAKVRKGRTSTLFWGQITASHMEGCSPFSYQEEIREIFKRHRVAFDERYVWD